MTAPSDDIAAAMARIKATLQERASAKPAGLPKFDWKAFGKAVRQAQHERGATQDALAQEIGITPTDLSRAMGNGNIAIEKVFAICDALRLKVRTFYTRPKRTKSTSCTSTHVKRRNAAL